MAESGNNWRIERHIIDKSLAAEMCIEVGRLASLTAQYHPVVTNETHVRGRSLSGYHCRVKPYFLGDGSEPTIEQFDVAMSQIPNLMHLFYARRGEIGSRAEGFGINILGRMGSIEPHRDAYLLPSSAVTLSGLSRTTIVDPVTNERHIFDLGIGDAFVLQNPADSEHPEHGVSNPRMTKRVAFVI